MLLRDLPFTGKHDLILWANAVVMRYHRFEEEQSIRFIHRCFKMPRILS